MFSNIRCKISGTEFKRRLVDYGCFLLGSAFYAFGFCFFISPNHISPGGITGLAAIINYVLGLPTGFLIVLLNIPILFWGYKKIGKAFLFKTLAVTILTSVFIDLGTAILPGFRGDRFLAAIFGGAISGLGLSLVLLRGSTTGGVDVVAKILRIKYPYLSIGRLVLILDGFVILLAAICYREIETALFAVISIFVSGKIIDSVLYGADNGRLLFVITDFGQEIADAIFSKVHRGVTIIESSGGYSNKNSKTLLCAMKKSQVYKAIKTVRETDPNAFTIVTVAGGIFGSGFEKEEI